VVWFPVAGSGVRAWGLGRMDGPNWASAIGYRDVTYVRSSPVRGAGLSGERVGVDQSAKAWF
jgi:hypothetical protein